MDYKSTTKYLIKSAYETFGLLILSFLVFYYLIFKKIENSDTGLKYLGDGLRYAYESLYNYDFHILALILGGIFSFLAIKFRPQKAKTNSKVFKFFRFIARFFLSALIVLAMYHYIGVTHGYKGVVTDLDVFLFMVYLISYIGLTFYLHYDNKIDAKLSFKNITNALYIIFGVIFFICILAFVEYKYQYFGQFYVSFFT